MQTNDDVETIELDEIDRLILNRIQSDFPLVRKPFGQVAADLGLTEAEVLERLSKLKETGIIRRIGGNFSPDKLGFVSTLCAAKVPEDKIAHFSDIINQYSEVTHNYQRRHEYNIWFTFIAPSRQDIENKLMQISSETGVHDILNLPATHVFKIRAQFEL